MLLVLCVLSALFSQDPPRPPDGWKGVNTYFGGLATKAGFLGFYEQNRQMIQMAMDSKNRSILVFPESVAGRWSQTTQALWEQEASKELVAKGVTVLLGAESFATEDSGSERYDAVIVAVGSEVTHLVPSALPHAGFHVAAVQQAWCSLALAGLWDFHPRRPQSHRPGLLRASTHLAGAGLNGT